MKILVSPVVLRPLLNLGCQRQWSCRPMSTTGSGSSPTPRPQYRLTYFNIRARAEPIRLLFAHARVPFEDIRIEGHEWPALKPKLPWQKMPVLEDGSLVLSQSRAILRYLSKKFGYVTGNDFQDAKMDEYMGTMNDFSEIYMKYTFEADSQKKEERRKQLDTKIFPIYLGGFDTILKESGGGFLFGNKITGADFFLANGMESISHREGPKLFEKYDALAKHQELIFNAPGIKEWVAKRPRKKF